MFIENERRGKLLMTVKHSKHVLTLELGEGVS